MSTVPEEKMNSAKRANDELDESSIKRHRTDEVSEI
jgi:hypothetical protein